MNTEPPLPNRGGGFSAFWGVESAMAKISDIQRALLTEAAAHPEGLIEAVTDRHRQPVEEGRAKAERLRILADDGRVIVFRITAKGRRGAT